MARGRGTRAGLNRNIVLAEGVSLLTEEGYSALSMRRLADRLGVTPTAIYSHVVGRSDLIDGMLDIVLEGVHVPREGSWATRLVELMQRVRAAIAAHPDLVSHYLNRRTVGPEALRIGGATMRILADAGLSSSEADQAMRALMIYTIGSAAINLPSKPEKKLGEAQRTARELSDQNFVAGLRWFVRGMD